MVRFDVHKKMQRHKNGRRRVGEINCERQARGCVRLQKCYGSERLHCIRPWCLMRIPYSGGVQLPANRRVFSDKYTRVYTPRTERHARAVIRWESTRR